MSDYFTMKHLIIFPARQSQLDDRVRAFVSSMNPNVDGVESSTVLGFAGTNGFSILDGLLTRHCEHLNEKEQIVDQAEIEDMWRDDGGLQNNPNLRGKLWLWRETNETISESVKQVLQNIDYLSRDQYEIDYLSHRIEPFEISEWRNLSNDSKRRDSFFWILTQQRH